MEGGGGGEEEFRMSGVGKTRGESKGLSKRGMARGK